MEGDKYAGFGIRLGAALIDGVVYFIVLGIPLALIYGTEYWTEGKLYYGIWDLILGYVVPITATLWFWIKFFGTPGKMVLGLRLVDAKTGGALSVGQSIIRYIGYSVAAIPLALGLFWIAFDKRKQGWHDKMAGTVVVHRNGRDAAQLE